MRKLVYFCGGISCFLIACTTTTTEQIVDAPVMSAYYSDWDRAVRADVDMQNMYIGTPSQISKPIDMYMAMALALKYNYTRRLASYKESLAQGNFNPNSLPMVAQSLGYETSSNSGAIPADLKISWNILDISSSYYQNSIASPDMIAMEENRKVINTLLQEARSLYWKTLAAQRLLPVIDDMSEYLVRIVDELNSRSRDLARQGQTPSTNLLVKKRQYLESIQQLSDLRKKLDTAQIEFLGLLGLHTSTDLKLAGSEYGNFSIPSMRAKLPQLEWLALTNRPELRVFDGATDPEELKLVIRDFEEDVDSSNYRQDPSYYNRKWAKNSYDISMNVFEDVSQYGELSYNSLARQRLTNIILNQVSLAWALYQSSVENYYLNMGVATTSEDIAENITTQEGEAKAISRLESARAIADEVNAFLAYVDVQSSIGQLYSSIGVDAVPLDMIDASPSEIAVHIRKTFDKWKEGIFITRPGMAGTSLSNRKPPVDISSSALVPNVVIGAGTDVNIKIPDEVFNKVAWNGEFKTIAGSLDTAGLPRWLKYDDKTHTFYGRPSFDDEGSHKIKVYALDQTGNAAVLSFVLTVDNMYINTMEYKGLTGYRRAKVYHRCSPGAPCARNDI